MTSSPPPRVTLSSHIEPLVKELGHSDSAMRELVTEQVSAYTQKFDTILNTEGALPAFLSHWPLPQATARQSTYIEGRPARLQDLEQYLPHETRTNDVDPPVQTTQLAAALDDVQTLSAALRHDSHLLASFSTDQPASLHFPSPRVHYSAQSTSRPRLDAISTAKHDHDPRDPFSLSTIDDASFATEPDSPSPLTPLDPKHLMFPPEPLLSVQAPSRPPNLSCAQTLSTLESTASYHSLESRRHILSRLDSFSTFHALSSLTDSWRLAASQLSCLTFLGEDNIAVNDVAFPSLDMLRDVAPRVTSLSINIPFSHSPLHKPCSPARDSHLPLLSYLLIDEGDSALWTPDRMITTLAVLQAEHIRDLRIRNASRATVRHCVKFTDSLRACVLLDDCLKFVDYSDMAQTFHGAAGQYITSDSFLFCKMFLWTLKSLTLGEWMHAQELDLLFGTGCFPRGLETLRIWHGGAQSLESLQGRTRLLEYRASGRSCCLGLSRLCLTTTRPLEDIASYSASDKLAGPQIATVVSLEVIGDFLEHIHGREIVVWREVELELDGVLVSTSEA